MHRIVTFIDLSDVTEEVIRVTCQLARAIGSRVYLIHVESPDTDFDGTEFRSDVSRQGVAREMHRAHRALHILELELRHQRINATGILVHSHSSRGTAVGKVLQEMRRLKPDLVIVGSHSHGFFRHLLSRSVTDAVMQQAKQPVVVVPSPERTSSPSPPRRPRKPAQRKS